jgi:predicted AAA+ superfamily ATPase
MKIDLWLPKKIFIFARKMQLIISICTIMLERAVQSFVFENLAVFPAVVILGARQCGKSTLIKMMSDKLPSFIYLDLQNIDDLNKLNEPTLFFTNNTNSTICLDEIQLIPHLFSTLRSEIDRDRRKGRFILLGSASRDLIQHSSESLAGRIGYVEMSPFGVNELIFNNTFNLSTHWIRGGFPDSYLASSDNGSLLWRENFIRTFVERDIPQLGFQIPALQMRRFIIMLAHLHGQLLNQSKLGESLGLSHTTIRKYIDLLEQSFIVRSLQPYEVNIKKRLVKSPKVYIRDSGLLHCLLQITNYNDLLGNPAFGSSWEGLVIETIITNLSNAEFYFYRTSSGDEIDLIIKKNNKLLAIECKASTAPKLTKGFWRAVDLLTPDFSFIVSPIKDTYLFAERVEVCSIEMICQRIDKELL